jgi:hypothetical protein
MRSAASLLQCEVCRELQLPASVVLSVTRKCLANEHTELSRILRTVGARTFVASQLRAKTHPVQQRLLQHTVTLCT